MFEKDGYHITVAFLLRDGKPVNIRELRPGEHGHKYLMMRGLAHEVAKRGADAVILISETWSAPADPAKPMMRAADSPDRRELLTGTVVSKAGESLYLAAEIKRNRNAVTLEPTVEGQGGAHFAFAPVYEAWGKPIPADWASGARIVPTMMMAGIASRKHPTTRNTPAMKKPVVVDPMCQACTPASSALGIW